MTTHSPLLEFASIAFPIDPDEDAETGPGIYGYALAEFVRAGLAAKAWEVEPPYPDEVGWCVPVHASGMRFYVACTNGDTEGTRWQTFAFVDTGVFGGVRADPMRDTELARLYDALRALLESAREVSDLRVTGG